MRDNRVSKLKPEEVAAEIGMPVSEWPGKCHEIAALCLVAGLTEGRLRYGHWLGRGGPAHHGWVEVRPAVEIEQDPLDLPLCVCGRLEEEHPAENDDPCEDFIFDRYLTQVDGHPARVFDPTRFVFERVAPYVFDGEDHEDFYDARSERLNGLVSRPFPRVLSDAPRICLRLSSEVRDHLYDLIRSHGGSENVSAPTTLNYPFQIWGWLASRPLSELGVSAEPLFRALIQNEMGGAIPIDAREDVLGDGFYGKRAACEARVAKARATKKIA